MATLNTEMLRQTSRISNKYQGFFIKEMFLIGIDILSYTSAWKNLCVYLHFSCMYTIRYSTNWAFIIKNSEIVSDKILFSSHEVGGL